ncbi:MAG: hypothetical protein JWL77_2872 [Chthonomonadaceae bacterium]|nr:hypothetical protein [Chthonomonadaceae bacterium]
MQGCHQIVETLEQFLALSVFQIGLAQTLADIPNLVGQVGNLLRSLLKVLPLFVRFGALRFPFGSTLGISHLALGIPHLALSIPHLALSLSLRMPGFALSLTCGLMQLPLGLSYRIADGLCRFHAAFDLDPNGIRRAALGVLAQKLRQAFANDFADLLEVFQLFQTDHPDLDLGRAFAFVQNLFVLYEIAFQHPADDPEFVERGLVLIQLLEQVYGDGSDLLQVFTDMVVLADSDSAAFVQAAGQAGMFGQSDGLAQQAANSAYLR